MPEEYKNVRTTFLTLPRLPSREPLRGLRPMEYQPFHNLMRAQDTIVGATKRVIWALNQQGNTADITPEGTTNGGAQVFPEHDVWRLVGTHNAVVTPSTYLECHVLAVPSGGTEFFDGTDWHYRGAFGSFRIDATWTNGAASDGPNTHSIDLMGSELPDGDAPDDEWQAMFNRIITEIYPEDVEVDKAISEDFSEFTEVLLEIYQQGGARIIDAAIYEKPLRHSSLHSDRSAKSCHAYAKGGLVPLTPQTLVPQTEARDGATYEESRFGTNQVARVAHQQASKLGPHIVGWSSPQVEADSLGATANEQDHIALSGPTTPAGIFQPTLGTWDPDNDGWLVDGSYALLHALNDANIVMDGRAVVPVVIKCTCEFIAGNGTFGTMRFQSSETEWIDITFTSASKTTLTAYGLLESQVAGDQIDRGILWVSHFNDGNLDELRLFDFDIYFDVSQ